MVRTGLTMQQTDADLVRAGARGMPAARRAIVDRHGAAVYNLAVRLVPHVDVSEAVARQSFRKAFARLDSYDPSYPLRVWLLRLTHNTALDALRDDVPVPSRPADGAFETALLRLRISQRAALVLRYHENLAHDHVGHVMGVAEDTVRSFVRAGRQEMARMIRPVPKRPEPREGPFRRER